MQAKAGIGAARATDTTAKAIGGRSARRRRTQAAPDSAEKQGSPAWCTAADVIGTATTGADRVAAHPTDASPVPRPPAAKVAVSEPLLDLFDPAPENDKTEWGRVVSNPAVQVVIEDLYEDENDIFC